MAQKVSKPLGILEWKCQCTVSERAYFRQLEKLRSFTHYTVQWHPVFYSGQILLLCAKH